MLHFYFGVTFRVASFCDDTGHELDGLENAAADAMASAGELARELLCKGTPQDVRVDVRDECRQQVLSVAVSMKVGRREIPSKAPA